MRVEVKISLQIANSPGEKIKFWFQGFKALLQSYVNFIDIYLRVPLANGGSLVIEQTEALVSIDVNGGHGMFGHETSQENAILDVNLAAAKQVR